MRKIDLSAHLVTIVPCKKMCLETELENQLIVLQCALLFGSCYPIYICTYVLPQDQGGLVESTFEPNC